MTVFRADAEPPIWCQLRRFEIIRIDAGQAISIARRSPKERVLVTSGVCQVFAAPRSQALREGQFFDIPGRADEWRLRAARLPCQLVLLGGRWGDELGGCGLFSLRAGESSLIEGDPVDYVSNTGFDSHYHDCDEYWVILEGAGTVVVGTGRFNVVRGDCVAIGTGHHHDLPEVVEPVRAAYFETTLEGQKRVGHLWNHTHGPARPRPERV